MGTGWTAAVQDDVSRLEPDDERLIPDPVIEAYNVVTLPALIRLKRAAGRPKDLEAIAELEALLEEQRGER
jgi:hypothetical protein